MICIDKKEEVRMSFLKKILIAIGCCIALSCITSKLLDTSIHWNWSKIDTSHIHFPRNFLFGAAGAAYQYLGAHNCPNCNWSCNIQPGVGSGEESGAACDFWRYASTDIQLMKEIQLKAFRFSFEWSDIEPQPGTYDEKAIKKYTRLIAQLKQNGIEPFMTLHHFTLPHWFEQRGGFADPANNQFFIDFCTKMVQEFGHDVKFWATFNEPGIYISNSYMIGEWPPGIKNIEHAGMVLKNMMQLHVQLYGILKKINPRIQIGFAHNVSPIQPYNPWNPIERIVAYFANQVYHEIVTTFFETGKFSFSVPFIADIRFEDKNAPTSFDYFGLNYYTSLLVRMHLNVRHPFSIACGIFDLETYKSETCAYAEGMYVAIKDISQRITHPRKIPMYITENGIADDTDVHRPIFIKRSLYALSKATADGYDVRGYFYWSLLDNFEWAEGYAMKFGLYDVDFATQKRTLRPGAQPFIDIVRATYTAE